ncbi:hypothetical protein [Parahaliea mediterranea]|uniref:Uncharacterized protein n=1 Tax=Parahaliea mediterranea TaxID=651086 RepID=A0A939INY2_9GAMM|nr:hypothetical protein [Parahaliea mediterranea]MBN7799020.1 hypothetical protein [Parahaliea mediterranea]
MRFRPPFLALVLSFTPLVDAQEKDFPGIEKLMTREEFQAAGLEKLSPAEREALNQWLIGYTVDDAQTLIHTSEEVKEADQGIRIEASVNGPFKGWYGDTVFSLDNGQTWRQRLSGNFAYHGDDRRVVIEKNFFGYFKLTHVATGRSVGVSRVNQ